MRDAAMFPIYASCALFGLYLVFKVRTLLFFTFGLVSTLTVCSSQYLPKEYVNLLLNILFFSLGVSAIARASRLVWYCICGFSICRADQVFIVSVAVDGLLAKFSVLPWSKYTLQLTKHQSDAKKGRLPGRKGHLRKLYVNNGSHT